MSRLRKNRKSAPSAQQRTLGTRVFAAITAVEGLRLSPASSKRLRALQKSSLSPEERRAEVLRAYAQAHRKV